MTDVKNPPNISTLQPARIIPLAEKRRDAVELDILAGRWNPPTNGEMDDLLTLVRIAYRTIILGDELGDDIAEDEREALVAMRDAMRQARETFDRLAVICGSGFDNLVAVGA